jgi:dTDP-4-dehydrorhamnose reductase
VGARLQPALAPLGTVLATSRHELDLADAQTLRQRMRDARPDVIVNAAAYTAVDKAETETGLATAINAVAPGTLAEEAKRLGALLVHFSTDYVFSGEASLPYREEDATAPINVYGRTKLEGEERIRASGCRHLILRTSWVYDTRGRNFLLTILKRARAGEKLRVVGDQQGVPNWSATIARVTARCIQSGGEGLFHLSAAGATSWHGFAREALERLGVPAKMEEITTREYPTPARRPRYSVLANGKLERALGLRFADWREDLREALGERCL